jgi:hypothetical protein
LLCTTPGPGAGVVRSHGRACIILILTPGISGDLILKATARPERRHRLQHTESPMTDRDPTEAELTKEQRILRVMQTVLTDVARDTHTPPGMRHPLTDKTIQNIRDCLSLIVERQRELAEALGQEMNMRPRYVDEPKKTDTVVHINVESLRKKP